MVFGITQYLPGDVAQVVLGREAGEEALESFREKFGLNDPIPEQYIHWLSNFIQGNWGESISTRSQIRPVVVQRLVNSLILAGMTMVISVPFSVSLGVIAGLNENKWVDNLISVFSLSVVGLPEFVTGLVLIEIFSRQLNLLPGNSSIRQGTPFFQALPRLILPALTASFVLLAYIARLTRAGVIAELHKPYIRTAVLKGMPWKVVVLKHLLRNALLPTITVIAISFGWLISGLIVIENVFNYPGLGRLLVFAIDRRDIPLIQAVTMVTVLGFALANLVADFLYAFLNPRIRYQ